MRMGMKLDVVISPDALKEDELQGYRCVVIDVLRATSTIITALVSGAEAIYPCLEIEEARRSAAMLDREQYLLGGEDKGFNIPGFDMGNSPLEYCDEALVGGKHIYFYTSNGTKAIRRAYIGSGNPVHIAALLNISAVSSIIVSTLVGDNVEGIVILCAGRYGKPSAEDLFCAGLIVGKAGNNLRQVGIVPELSDSARIASEFALAKEGASLDVLTSSEHGRFLQSIGFESDLEYTSRLDVYNIVPVFNGERVALPG